MNAQKCNTDAKPYNKNQIRYTKTKKFIFTTHDEIIIRIYNVKHI